MGLKNGFAKAYFGAKIKGIYTITAFEIVAYVKQFHQLVFIASELVYEQCFIQGFWQRLIMAPVSVIL